MNRCARASVASRSRRRRAPCAARTPTSSSVRVATEIRASPGRAARAAGPVPRRRIRWYPPGNHSLSRHDVGGQTDIEVLRPGHHVQVSGEPADLGEFGQKPLTGPPLAPRLARDDVGNRVSVDRQHHRLAASSQKGQPARSITTRVASPARTRSNPSDSCASPSRWETSRSSGSRPRRYRSRISGKSRSGRADP